MSLQQETMKTVEGTVAGCLSQIIALGIILSIGNGRSEFYSKSFRICFYLESRIGVTHGLQVLQIVGAIIIGSALETATFQIDNIVVPLVTFSLLIAV